MSYTEVVNLRDLVRGERRGVVKVDRTGPWGNPFDRRFGDREEVLRLYLDHVLSSPDLMEAMRVHLTGRRIGCWCRPLPCHADVIASVCDRDWSRLAHWRF